MSFTFINQTVRARTFPKLHDLVTQVGVTTWGTKVFDIKDVGIWIAPFRLWFDIDADHDLRVVTRPITRRARSSRKITTTEELLETLEERLLVLEEIDGGLYMAGHPYYLLEDKIRVNPTPEDLVMTLPRAMGKDKVKATSATEFEEGRKLVRDIFIKHYRTTTEKVMPNGLKYRKTGTQ